MKFELGLGLGREQNPGEGLPFSQELIGGTGHPLNRGTEEQKGSWPITCSNIMNIFIS